MRGGEGSCSALSNLPPHTALMTCVLCPAGWAPMSVLPCLNPVGADADLAPALALPAARSSAACPSPLRRRVDAAVAAAAEVIRLAVSVLLYPATVLSIHAPASSINMQTSQAIHAHNTAVFSKCG